MPDSSIGVREDATPSHKVDNEAVTGHPDGTVQRQRTQIAGASLAEIARVKAAGSLNDDMALVVRPVPSAVTHEKYLNLYLTSTGIAPAAGTEQANVNGSAPPIPFFRGPAAGVKWVVNRLLITIKDGGNVSADKYGALAPLVFGMGVEITNLGPPLDLLEGVQIKTSTHWARECHDHVAHDFGAGDSYLTVRWTFMRAGRGILLDGDLSEAIAVIVNDDLSALSDHWFKVQGYIL